MTQNNNLKSDNPVCPHCHASHDPASACLTEISISAAPSGALVAQAETLFESYLAARLVRARRNLTATKVALLRDPRNRDKRDALMRAESEAQRLETQLLEQVRRTAQARERASETARAPQPLVPGRSSTSPTEDFRTLQAAKANISVRKPEGDAVAEPFLSEDEIIASRSSKLPE